MHKRYPSLQAMQAFLQAAGTGSFTAAAKRLDLTHGAISQQIRTLEDHVGQALFARHGGRVQLTDAGQLFASGLAEGFAQIDRSLAAIKQPRVPRQLLLDVDPELSQSWLIPRLYVLARALPDHQIVISSASRALGLDTLRFDLALRYGYGEWGDFPSVQLCDDQVLAVGAPALLRTHRVTPDLTPEKLMELPLLNYTKRSWVLWLEAAGLLPVEPPAQAVFDDAANLMAAAAQGLGVCLVRRLLAADALADGRLVQLTQVTIPTRYNCYVIWPQDRADKVEPAVRALREAAASTLM